MPQKKIWIDGQLFRGHRKKLKPCDPYVGCKGCDVPKVYGPYKDGDVPPCMKKINGRRIADWCENMMKKNYDIYFLIEKENGKSNKDGV